MVWGHTQRFCLAKPALHYVQLELCRYVNWWNFAVNIIGAVHSKDIRGKHNQMLWPLSVCGLLAHEPRDGGSADRLEVNMTIRTIDTENASIFMMSTVVNSHSCVIAPQQCSFTSTAPHVIQKYWSSSSTKITNSPRVCVYYTKVRNSLSRYDQFF